MFFLSSNSHDDQFESIHMQSKMRPDIPTVVIDMEPGMYMNYESKYSFCNIDNANNDDALVLVPDEKHALLPIVEQDEGRDVD